MFSAQAAAMLPLENRRAKVRDLLIFLGSSMRMSLMKSKPTPMRASAPLVERPPFPTWLFVVLLVLVTIALYWPAMQCDFINLDDPDYVTENPHVQGGLTWAGVKWAFGNTEQAAYWAPLMWLSHLLAWQFFGANPWGHHLVNVLLHAASTGLVFLVFQQMTRATWRSLILATLFGWHPLRVESAAWVTERKDVLSTLFWMLTLLAYVQYVEASRVRDSKSKFWYGAALVMFVSGLMSKAMLVTMPCVLLLLDYWPLERFQPGCVRRLVWEKIPFFTLATAASILTFLAQKQGGAVTSMENLSLGARSGNALVSYCRYLGDMFWPTDLAVFYPHPGYWPPLVVLLAGGLLSGISVLLCAEWRRYPFLLVGWLWYIGTLVPVIQLVQAGSQAMADRFTYIPSLGVLVITIWGTCELTKSWRCQKVVLSVAGSAAIILCLALTRHQLGYWKDSETLFRHTLEVTENNYLAHNNLGTALDKKGRTGEAISQFQEAIRLKPDRTDGYFNLGNALIHQGQIGAAMSQYQEVIRRRPGDFGARVNLGVALFNQGRTDGAASQFQEAIRLKPEFVPAHIDLANALLKLGRIDEAIAQCQEAVRLKPDDATAQRSLAMALKLKNNSTGGTPDPVKPKE
jgi:Flp pilus assembly protein TadD